MLQHKLKVKLIKVGTPRNIEAGTILIRCYRIYILTSVRKVIKTLKRLELNKFYLLRHRKCNKIRHMVNHRGKGPGCPKVLITKDILKILFLLQ